MIKIIISDYLDAYASSVTFQGSTAGARRRLPASVSRGHCHPNTAAAQAVRGFPSLACPPGGTGDTGARQRQRSTAAPAPAGMTKPAGTGEKSSFLPAGGRLDVFSGSRAAAFCSSAFFSLQRVAFPATRPAVSRRHRGVSAHVRPGGAVLPPCVLPFQGQNALSVSIRFRRARPGRGTSFKPAQQPL